MASVQSKGSRGGKRPTLATLHRKGWHEFTDVVWNRHYSATTRAIHRAVELALLSGMPGDVVEFSHADYGFQIATVKLLVGGRIDIQISEDLKKEV